MFSKYHKDVVNKWYMNLRTIFVILTFVLTSQKHVYSQCNPMPKADFTVNPFCETDSAFFINTSQNAETWLWKFGDGKISTDKSPKHFYHSSGTHNNVTLVAKQSNGCADSITKPFVLIQNPSSDFIYSINQNEATFTALLVGSTSYQWHFKNGDSLSNWKVTYKYKQTTTDRVCLKVTNAAGCYSETCKEVLITLGLTTDLKTFDFKIYPNPSSKHFQIVLPENSKSNKLEIYTQLGQLVLSKEITEQTIYLDTDLTTGMYIIKITNSNQTNLQKLIVH